MDVNTWKLLWKTLERIIKRFKKRYTILSNIPYVDSDGLSPTQRDKPSPHSSLTLAGTLRKLNEVYSDTQYVKSYVANTNSMEPLIDDNCIVVLEKLGIGPLDRQPLVPGDVCVYEVVVKDQKCNVLHQIVQVSDNGTSYKFQGINNYYADGWVPGNKIKWRLHSISYCRAMREDD